MHPHLGNALLSLSLSLVLSSVPLIRLACLMIVCSQQSHSVYFGVSLSPSLCCLFLLVDLHRMRCLHRRLASRS